MCIEDTKFFKLFMLRFGGVYKSASFYFTAFFGIIIFFSFMSFEHSDKVVDNAIFWNKIIPLFSMVLGIQFTVITFVLSIYFPPIIKDLKDLSIGVNKSVVNELIKLNEISQKIYLMSTSIVINVGIFLGLYLLTLFRKMSDSDNFIIFLALICYVSSVFWLLINEIWQLAKTNGDDNYVQDCLSLASIDKDNQDGYFKIISRCISKYLKNHNELDDVDTYRLNRDLIQVIKFINETKNYTYCDQYCIRKFLSTHDQRQYLYFIISSYDNPVRYYDFTGENIEHSFFNVPIDNIEKFQNYMFATDSPILPKFVDDILGCHKNLDDNEQLALIDYYLWFLDNLCVLSCDNDDSDKSLSNNSQSQQNLANNYPLSFALDMISGFKDISTARKFLREAMKIACYRKNKAAINGLYRGYLTYLQDNSIEYYSKLKRTDGGTAWLFSDLIRLTIIHKALNVSISHVYGVEHLMQKIVKYPTLLLEWLAFLYFCNNILIPNNVIKVEPLGGQELDAKIISLLNNFEDNNPIDIIKCNAFDEFTKTLETDKFNSIGNTEIKELRSRIIGELKGRCNLNKT